MITHKVSKTSVKASLLKIRRLVVAFVLFLIAQMGWGETYYWTGAAGDGKWSTSGNWNTAPDGSGTTLTSGYPNDSDNVNFPKGAEINVDVAPTEINGIYYLYINSLYIPKNNIENSDFTVKLTGNPIYVYDLIEIYRATGPTAGDSKSTLELDCDIVASELVIHSGTTVQIDSGHTANITNVTNVGGNDYPAKIIVEGSLISDKITLSDNSDRILEITGGSVETGIITGTSNSVINNGSLSISNVSGSDIGVLKAGGNGTLDLNGDNTYIWKGTEDEDWANANNWTGGVPNSDTAVIRIENDSPYPTVKSGDEYEIKSIDNYNQPKINIYGKLKINDDFCYAVGVDSEYTQIDSNGSGVLELTGKFYTKTIFSIGVSIICNDFQTGSNFECENLTVNGNAKIGAMVVTHGFQHYAGTLSGDLNDFDPNDYSDITLISHYNSNNDSNITIAGAVSKITTLQIQGYDDLTIQNTISDIENLILDTSESSSAILNGQVNITNEFRTSAPVLLKQNVYVGGDVYGPFVSDTGQKLVFNGSGDQNFSPATGSSDFTYTIIEENKNSGSLTIENFSSNVKITDFVIEQGVETIIKQGGEITNLTIKNGGTTKFTDNITIDTLTDLSTAGNIIFQDDVTVKNVTGQTFNTTEKIIFDYDANTTFGTSSPYSNIKHVAGPTEIYGQLTVNSIEFGETTIYHWVETNGDQKYTDAVILVGASDSLEGELELISRQGKISFESTINSKENYSVGLGISLQNDDYAISLADSVGLVNPLKYFNVYKPLKIASGCTAITTTGSQGYQDTVTIDEDVTLTSGSTITFASTIDSKTDTTKKITFEVPTDKAISVDGKVGNSKPVAVEVTQAGSITFNNTVNITEFTDHDDSGDVTFNEDATISNASGTTFSTTGTVTFGNAPTDETTFRTSSSSLAALTHSAGPTVLNGTLNASNITLGNTNATPGTISIPSGSISASGTVSLDGALTSSDSVSITAGTLAFNAPVEVKNITMNAVATTSQDFTVTGNWTNNKAKSGTTYGFTATGGTITFTGANPTDSAGVLLSGENKFNELEILGSVKITDNNEIITLTADNGTSGLGGKTITFADSTTQTVTGTMSLKGTSSDSKLVLYANAGDEWEINCTGTNNHTIKYVDVYNSNNSSSYNLVALNSSDKGHNTKWTFPGEDYEWTGADPTYPTRWDVAANWIPASVPGLGADVTIPTGILSYPIISSAIDLYYNPDNKGSITNNGTITFNESGSITADTKENGSGSTIIYDGSFTNATTLDWGYEYENLTFTSGTFNLSDALSVNNFTVGSAAKVSTTANITVTGNWTNNNSTDGFTATGGTVKLTTASNDTTRATLSGANTFYNLNLDRNIAVLGSNTISQDLIMHRTAGDANAKGNIYFAANTKQTIGGKFDFKGLTTKRLLATCGNATAETNGNWEIECTGSNNHELQNINLKGCLNSSGYPLVVQDPDGTQANGKSQDSGGNINFYFLNHAYTWQGGANDSATNWGNASYWSPASVPGKGSVITIPAGKTSYPVLTGALNLKYNDIYAGSITIDDGGKYDLADKSLTVGTITNNGLVRLKGSASQIDGSVDNGTSDSTIEYYDTTTELNSSTLAWGNSYKKLIINKPANLNDVPLTVSKTTTIAAGEGKTVSLDNSGNSFGETIYLGDSAAATPVNAGAVTIKAASAITIANNANADSFTVNSTVKLQNVTTSGNQTYSGTVETITGEAAINSTAGDISFENPVTLGVQTSVTANGTGKTITFGNAATINGGQSLSLSSDGGTTFGANVGDSTPLSALTVTGPLTVNCGIIKTSGDQTYTGAVTLGAASNITSTAGDISIENTGSLAVNADSTFTVSTSGKKIDFSGAITGTAKLTTAGSGTVNLNNTVNVASLETQAAKINTGTINTSGSQQYNGKVSLGIDTALTATGPTGEIDFGATIDGTKQLTLSSTAGTTFGANVGNGTDSALASLEVSGPLTVNCDIIKTTGVQTYNNAVTIGANSKFTASKINYASNITDNSAGKTLTINAPVFNSTIDIGTAQITLGALTFTKDSTSLETANNTYINLNVPDIKGVGKTIVIDETLKNITLTPASVTVEPTIQTETGSKLTASSGTTTFKADVSLADGTLDANGGTIILTAANKTPAGTAATLSGNNTFKTLTLQGPVTLSGTNTITDLNIQDSVTISASNTITNLTANKTGGLGGKTITFGNGTEQTISGDLILKGSDDDDNKRLLLVSSTPGSQWEIKCGATSTQNIEFVDVKDSKNTSDYYLFAIHSWDTGNNTKWNFPGMKYVWEGTANNTWDNAANWKRGSIPGKGADIEIPAGCTNYPILEAALNLNETYNTTEYKGKITIKQKETGKVEGKFDLAGYNLTLGEIINYGLVRLKGSQAINGIMKNGEDGQKGTVEYYDNDPAAVLTSFVWDGDGNSEAGKKYYNLIINKNINQATGAGEQIKVSGTTTISAGNGKTVTLNNASNIFTGNVIAGSSADTSFIAGAVTLQAGSLITLANNANADSLTVNSAIKLQKVTTSEDQTYNGPVTVNGATNLIATGTDKHIYFKNDVSGTGTLSAQAANININCDKIESTGNQTYTGAVALDKNTELKSTTGGISFTSTVDGAKTLKLTSSSGTTFGGLVGGTVGDATNLSSLEVNGPAIINTSSITTSGLQTYNGAVTLGADTTLTSTGNNIALNTTLNGAHTITFSVPDNTTNTITVVGKVGGDSNIATPPSITIAQAGTVTFKETVKANALTLTKANSTTFEKAVDITSFADDTTNHTGTVTFAAGGTIQNDVTFNTDNIVTFTGIMNIGTDASRKNLVHTAGETKTVGTLNATTTQIGNLTLTGDTTITTSGTQTYNGTINDASAGAHTLTLNSGTSQITFASDVGQTAAPKVLTVNGPVVINGAAVTTSDQQNYNAAITSSGAITLKSAALNLNCSTVTTAGAQTYDGPVNLLSDTSLTLNTGDLLLKSPLAGAHKFTIAKTNDANFDGAVTVTDFEITLANDTQFAEPVAVTNFAITSANDTHFADTLTADSFSISQAANTIFNGAVTISSFTDAASAGNISFNAGGTISSATGTSFLTTGTVTFGDNQTDIMTFGSASPYADLKHTAGDTNITGLINAANITLAQTVGGPMTIANSGLFKTIDGAALTYTTSFAQTGTGNSVIGGSFTGNGNASFVTNVQISGTAPADFGSNGTTVSITKNLIILRNTSDDLNINSRVNVTENLVLYKGPVLANADITAGKDILVLGSTYSTSDTSTGITNEYAYACVRPVTWSQPNYIETLLPDATPVPELVEGPLNDFTATLSVASGTTISAAKNFYANGTVLQTSGSTGQWTLKLPDLTNAANGFAEAYHSEISGCKVICNDGTSTDGTKSRLVCLECDDTGTTNTPNSHVDFDDFEITAAYTERDNAIRVEFNRPFRFNSYTVDLLKFHDSSDAVSAGTNFTGLYADPDCQTPIEIGDNAYDYFYIKAAPQDSAETGAWNTDATGKTSGASDGQSTDRNGKHHTALPCLDFPRALQASASGQTYTVPFILSDIWGKRLNNYSRRVTKGSTAEAAYGSANSSNDLLDKTGPVLWKVRTGQELHTDYDSALGEACEHSYDAHNFIEFLYSEKVDFDGDETTNAPLNADPATAENVKVTVSFGALQNSNIEIAGALNFAGLGTIQNGLLWTGSAGVTSKEVNALYRKGTKAEYSIRLSIAGYTEGTVTDPDGNTYKKWIGYIEKAQMPTGTVTHIADSNTFVKDKEGNPQIKYEALNMIPEVDSTEDGLYGKWDLSEPVFAPVRQNKKTAWASQLFQKDYQAEAVGNNSGVGSTLDRIEFHLYDNTPDFDDDGNAVTGTPEWFSEVGWCALGSDGEKATDLYKAYTYAADIFGGARPFDSNTQRRTQGGIRYSTLHSAVNAFKYGINSGLSESNIKTSFDNSKNTWGGASSLIFTGSSSPRRSAGDLEGLYFALPLANTSLDIKTSFTIKYDEKTGFVTDLAGNRLRTKIISTIDRTPPSIDMTVCPVGGDDLQIIFVKELCTDSRDLNYIDGSGTKVEITEDFESLITECIDFIKIDSSGSPTVVSNLKIDNTSPAVIEFEENQNGSFFTKIKFKLNRKVTLEDVKNTFIRIIYTQKYGEYSVDLFTGHSGSRVTFIQDENGNNIQMYTAHALSDFAVGVIDPLYAYDSAMIEEDGTIISDSLLHQNLTEDVDRDSWSVHDWNRDQKNYGTLPAKRPLAIVADTTDGTEENEDAPTSFRLYLSNSPDAASISTQYNKDLEPDPSWRIWLPNEMSGVFTALSEKNNTNYSQVDGTLLSEDITNRMIFDINDTITNLWSAGNQISFLFGLTNSDGSPVTIMHSPELDINNDKQYLPTSAKMPLFALRQTESDDLLALDLWSFRLKDVVSQRGGVTILNNVINSSQREKVVVKVNQPQQGNLTVLVMTLDGSIVDYLHRGSSDAGEHFYSWDGTNRRGHSVARGMYFIRVTGPGIDETRKVMVVKD